MKATIATPVLTADIAVFQARANGMHVLLIQRGKEPHKGCYALPGGKLHDNETLEECATRELAEETNIVVSVFWLRQVGTYSTIGRDPRGHYISVLYAICIEPDAHVQAGDDASAVEWFPVSDLPELAFDHRSMIVAAFQSLIR